MDRLVQFRCEMRGLALEHIDSNLLWLNLAVNRVNIRRGKGRPLKESQIIDDYKKKTIKDTEDYKRFMVNIRLKYDYEVCHGIQK